MSDDSAKLLFNRKVWLAVAAPVASFGQYNSIVLEVENLRVKFKVTKSLSKEPNKAEVEVSNLSARSRALMQQKGGKFILQAGYATGMEQLFVGDVRAVDHLREGPDWTTRLTSGDGERAYRWARVNESYKAGTSVGTVINALVGALGLAVGNLNAVTSAISDEYVHGYSASGNAARELTKVLSSQGYSWSIQDGAVQILKHDATSSTQIPDLSSDTGLVGSPEFGAAEKNKGPVIKAKCLLSPRIKPGGRVHIRSLRFDGDLRVTKVEHAGDTDGNEWYSTLEGEPV